MLQIIWSLPAKDTDGGIKLIARVGGALRGPDVPAKGLKGHESQRVRLYQARASNDRIRSGQTLSASKPFLDNLVAITLCHFLWTAARSILVSNFGEVSSNGTLTPWSEVRLKASLNFQPILFRDR